MRIDARGEKGEKGRKSRAALVSYAALFVFLLSGCAGETETIKPEEVPIAVEIGTAELGEVITYRKFFATAKPLKEIYIVPKTPARVETINYIPGDLVKAGDVLFVLDDSDVAAAINQAAAAVDLARVGYDRSMNGGREQLVMQVESTLNAAKIQHDDALLALGRVQELYEMGAVSKQDLEQAESGYQLAKQQYDAAQRNYNLTMQTLIDENIRTAQAQLHQAQAGYESAVKQVGDMVVTADIDGVVGFSSLSVGSIAGGSGPVMSIIDYSSVYIEVGVTDDLVTALSRDDVCRVTFESASQSEFSGVVESVSPARSPSTGLYTVRVKVENPDLLIKAGMNADVRLSVQSAKDVVIVPGGAVLTEYGENFVFVLGADGRVEKRKVITGVLGENQTEIREGLSAGERVVTKGADYLTDNGLVEVVG